MNIYQPVISGSLTVTGSTTFFGNVTVNSGSLTMTSGSLTGTASLASNALLLQGTGSVGFATTASINEVSASQQSISASLLQVSASYIALSGSYNTFSGSASTRITAKSSSIQQVSSSQQQISASLLNVVANYATTGSNSFRANQSITGSLVVSSTITAQTLVVQTVTSSIVYSSGSNIFGSALGDRQTFTGSVNITGSLALAGNITGNAVTLTGALGGTSATFSSSVTATIFDSTSNAFRFNGSNALSLVTLNSQNVVKINAAGYWGTQLVGANDKGILIDNTGNVGIGTTTLEGVLTIKGTSAQPASSGTTANSLLQLVGSLNNELNIGSNTSAGGYGSYIQASDNNLAVPYSLNLQPNGGYVGIGTSNPTGSLDVSGSIYIRNTSGGVLYIPRMADQSRGLSIGEQTSLGSKSAVIRTAGGVSEHLFLDPGLNSSNVAGNIALVYANTGSVGIGTYLPVGKLDINTGGNRNVVISNDSTDTGYNIVSLNGSRTKGAYAGIAGGGTGDNSLYLNSGVDIVFQTGASFTQRMRTVNEFTLAGSAAGTGGPTQVIGTTSMCGILFVSIGTQNCAAVFIINAASAPVLVSQTITETRFSITSNNGNTANVYVSGTNIELQNNIQATRAFYCQFFGKL